jgi:hypothetical protein
MTRYIRYYIRIYQYSVMLPNITGYPRVKHGFMAQFTVYILL